MSDRAYLCISVCMLMCATAADGPEALAVRGATAIPGTRLPRGGTSRFRLKIRIRVQFSSFVTVWVVS